MRFALLFLTATLALAQVQHAQPEREQEARMVEARFAAGSAPDLAWAAQLAADYGHTEFVPRIVELLKYTDYQVRLAAIDALIRLKADVDNAAIEPLLTKNTGYYEEFDAAMVLAWRNQPWKRFDLLMRLLDNKIQSYHQWMVVTAMLATQPPERFASVLLRDWTFAISVVSPGETTGDPGPCPGTGVSTVYPNVAPYRIRNSGPFIEGKVTLVSGSHPLYVSRGGIDCTQEYIDRREWTRDYLREMARVADVVPVSTTIVFQNAKQYTREATAFRDKVEAYVSKLRSGLIRNKRLAKDDVTQPRITVVDGRGDDTLPLPKVDRIEPRKVEY